jgi:calcineurin-like phosphoesterase
MQWYVTDVGMCGALDASLGVKLDVIIHRWHDGVPSRNELQTAGRMQFNAVLVDADPATGLANSIERIQTIFD